MTEATFKYIDRVLGDLQRNFYLNIKDVNLKDYEMAWACFEKAVMDSFDEYFTKRIKMAEEELK